MRKCPWARNWTFNSQWSCQLRLSTRSESVCIITKFYDDAFTVLLYFTLQFQEQILHLKLKYVQVKSFLCWFLTWLQPQSINYDMHYTGQTAGGALKVTEWNLINTLCFVLWVIIVCPNHSCCLSLPRFYPLIASQERCQSVRQTHFIFTPSLCRVSASVSSLNPPKKDSCNSNLSTLLWWVFAHCLQQLHIFRSLLQLGSAPRQSFRL